MSSVRLASDSVPTRHSISNPRQDVGDCSVCGPDVAVVREGTRTLCRTARRETRKRSDAKWQAKPGNRQRRLNAMSDWHSRNKDEQRAKQMLRRYGMTPDDYDRMYRKQKGRCALCTGLPCGPGSQMGRLHIDHCHETGRVRGLLCGRCNTALGLLKHDADLIARAAQWVAMSAA